MRSLKLTLAFWAAAAATSTMVLADEPKVHRAADLARPVLVTADGVPIDVEGFAAPFVGDFDEDGKNDLLVGQCQSGRLRIYRNVGTNAQPKFAGCVWFITRGGVAGVPICCRVAFTPQLVDFDGDVDLLFGCYSNCLIENEGTGRNPVFGDALPLMLDEEQIPSGNVVGPCVADWDGDGRADLLAGRKGDIVWYRNTGEKGGPQLQKPEILVSAGDWSLGDPRRDDQPARYHAICVTDFNADGRLDLLLGDHFVKHVDLTEEQEAQVAEGMAKSSAMRRELASTPANETRPERIERFRKALREWQEHAALPMGFCQAASPRFERHGRVWFYERIASKKKD